MKQSKSLYKLILLVLLGLSVSCSSACRVDSVADPEGYYQPSVDW